MSNLNGHPTVDKPRISVELVRETTHFQHLEGMAENHI